MAMAGLLLGIFGYFRGTDHQYSGVARQAFDPSLSAMHDPRFVIAAVSSNRAEWHDFFQGAATGVIGRLRFGRSSYYVPSGNINYQDMLSVSLITRQPQCLPSLSPFARCIASHERIIPPLQADRPHCRLIHTTPAKVK
ncbi:uncharacterized protein EDB91DRAFT_81690 [Suillus paluster]|uniref:uncharacterized protein n=1 Tax=Suillus paluster TaxID=48578 RepID=UPI001B8738F2|nr:uncharacterized protein EDB91DRAFT_81690 [Suillus paluster]KAG1725792.1 hypothetical protein EDB91DRAFT_81690 [Suillus paluster]